MTTQDRPEAHVSRTLLHRRPPFAALAFVLGCSGADGSSEREPTVLSDDRTRLSTTGLYADTVAGELAPGVEAYTPAYELWSDGASKQRYAKLPEGTAIDSTDMDHWTFPDGTKLWKEFTRDGVRVETRLLEKTGGTWLRVAYRWNDEQTEAQAVQTGAVDASGTPHDIPDEQACHDCHGNGGDGVLGFSAIQLSHDGEGLTLQAVSDRGWLSTPPPSDLEVPGDAATKAALGYLHANCGNCHNDSWEKSGELPMRLYLASDGLGSVEDTVTYRTSVGVAAKWTDGLIVDPGAPESSAIVAKLRLRGKGQMPPVGTELVDESGITAVSSWIASLR
jgi:hypothetical protein